MPELTMEKRFVRVMKFLMASRDKRIAKLLFTRGFSDEDRKEGWALFDRATGRHLLVPVEPGADDSKLCAVVDALDRFENNWFDVVNAPLRRLFPAVHKEIFAGLSKKSGQGAVLSVRIFVERVTALRTSDRQDRRDAAAVLEKRGLTLAVLEEARALLKRIEVAPQSVAGDNDDEEQAQKEETEQGMKAMWAWYRDWSETARTVIKNRNYLVMLGLRQHRPGAPDNDGIDNLPANGG